MKFDYIDIFSIPIYFHDENLQDIYVVRKNFLVNIKAFHIAIFSSISLSSLTGSVKHLADGAKIALVVSCSVYWKIHVVSVRHFWYIRLK